MCHGVTGRVRGVGTINFGSLNVRGIKREEDKQKLADDLQKYHVQVLAIQETHLPGSGALELKTSDGKNTYDLFYTGEEENKYHGVGIVVEQTLKPQFKTITDRICLMKTQLLVGENKERELTFISTYAHTLSNSEKHPELRERYYEELDTLINNTSNRSLLVVAGDFNAKTSSAYKQYPENLGTFGKGQVNSNGEYLLETARKNQLCLTNTLFYHKMAHRTTWVCPERKKEHCDKHGNIRRNPYRNQIDYILVKTQHRNMLQNSRSYSGMNTSTDHRLVVANMKLTWYKCFETNKKEERYDLEQLKTPAKHIAFTTGIEALYNEKTSQQEEPTAQQQWDAITSTCIEIAGNTIKRNKNAKKSENPRIQQLSENQKKIRQDINANTNNESRVELRKKRNQELKEIHKLLAKEETDRIESLTEDIENSKDDSTRMYKAVRALQATKQKKKLIVEGEKGLATNEVDQANIITKHFTGVFRVEDEDEIEHIPPAEMQIPFTEIEISRAVKSLKNNKSAGCDNLRAEMIKHSPKVIHGGIAKLLNHTAATGDYPREIKQGILIPLPKPGKKQGPPQNLRPIILLSILRKILAVIMIRRTSDKLNSRIPITQAAYRSGRSTTEHVFTFKILAEKAIASSNYEINLLLLDMSKAFDTVKRATIMKDLSEVLDPDELHMFYILLKDVTIQVRCGKTFGEDIITNIGTPQGDCASAILFTFYLAKSIQDRRTDQEHEHSYARPNKNKEDLLPEHLHDHTYTTFQPDSSVSIDQQYADDIGWATTNIGKCTEVKKTIPARLKERNLYVNNEKTEEYIIKRHGQEKWKKCKYLGSLLDTEHDIKRRKGLAIDTFNNFKHIMESKKVSTETKMRIFQAFVNSIFLYNSELWTLTKALAHKIDVFQRSLLRRVVGTRRVEKMSNIDLYCKTETIPWSQTIKRRRLNWLGHLLRLPDETPAKQALNEFLRKTKRPPGKPKTTWLSQIKQQLSPIGIDPYHPDHVTALTGLANDRDAWRAMVRRAMSTDGKRS